MSDSPSVHPLASPTEVSPAGGIPQALGGKGKAAPRLRPPKDGTPFLAWYPRMKLDEDDELTDEPAGGGAWAIVSVKGKQWDEPEWLSSHGSYFFEDWEFAQMPTHWMPLPAPPTTEQLSVNARSAVSVGARSDERTTDSPQGAEHESK